MRQQRNLQKTDASAGHSEQQIASNQQDQKVEELSVVKQQKTVSLRVLRSPWPTLVFTYLLVYFSIYLLFT